MSFQLTINRLRELRLAHMAEAYALQHQQPKVHELSFDDRFALLVEREASERESKKLDRLIRAAACTIANNTRARRVAGEGTQHGTHEIGRLTKRLVYETVSMETVHASNARYPDWYPFAPVNCWCRWKAAYEHNE